MQYGYNDQYLHIMVSSDKKNKRLMEEQTVFSYINCFHMFILMDCF